MATDLRPGVKHGTITGYTNGGCRCVECAAMGAAWRAKRREREKKPPVPRLPVEPLLPYFADHESRKVRHYLYRYQATGVTVFKVDELCCRLGLHPWMIYGDTFFQDVWEGETNVD